MFSSFFVFTFMLALLLSCPFSVMPERLIVMPDHLITSCLDCVAIVQASLSLKRHASERSEVKASYAI